MRLTFPIESERLRFELFQNKHAEDLFEMDGNPEVHRYLGNEPFKTLADSYKDVIYVQKQFERNGTGRLIAVEKNSNKCIGWGGIKYVDDMVVNGITNYYDLGYRLNQKYWRKGYGFEIGKISADIGFLQLKVPVLNAWIHHANKGSKRILEKLGFTFINDFEFEGIKCYWFELKKEDYLTQ